MEFVREDHNWKFNLKNETTVLSYCESKIQVEMWAVV